MLSNNKALHTLQCLKRAYNKSLSANQLLNYQSLEICESVLKDKKAIIYQPHFIVLPTFTTMAPEGVKVLSMGPHTLSVPVELFALNRSRLVASLKNQIEDSVVLLQGGDEVPFYDTDITYNTFR